MNKKQIEELKRKLEENRDSLRRTLQRFAKEDEKPEGDWDTVYPDFEGGGMEEEADEVEEYNSLLSVEYALENKLKFVNEALERIEKGDYGNCEKCGKEISYEKLSLAPETKHCRDCS